MFRTERSKDPQRSEVDEQTQSTGWRWPQSFSYPFLQLIKDAGSRLHDIVSPAQNEQPFPGLTNLGNTCFFNSILQCLRATPNLEQALANDAQILAADKVKEVRLREFENEPCGTVREDFLAFSRSTGDRFTPRDLRRTLGRTYPIFTSGAQEEAHEALGNVLNCLPGLKYMMKHTMRITITASLAEVQLKAKQKVKHDTNLLFKIPLPEPIVGQPQDPLNLQALFEATAKVTEIMARDNRVVFEQIDNRGEIRLNATKITELVDDRGSLPAILAVRLTREIHKGWDSVNKRMFDREKNNASVVFGPELTMPRTGIKYELYAVSRHSGATPNSGHWTAHVKHTGSWYLANDTNVTAVGPDAVFGEDSFKQACILFYRKVEDDDPSRVIAYAGDGSVPGALGLVLEANLAPEA